MEIDAEPPTMRAPNPSVTSCLPWVEKYRPAELSELVSQASTIETISRFVDAKSLPHLLFYGPPGTGKTSTILACARKLYGKAFKGMTLELNASDDRGINVVREEIKSFASTKAIFGSGFKLIILDEADSMTQIAQAALRRVIEKYTKNVRFCIICNYVSKIIPALQSRCTRFRFNPLSNEPVRRRLVEIATIEKVDVADNGFDAILSLSGGDMRRALNIMQSTHAAFGRIDFGSVYTTTASPLPADMDELFAVLFKNEFTSVVSQIRSLGTGKGYSLADILPLIFERLTRYDMPSNSKVILYETLAELEYRLAQGCSERIQAGELAGVFRIAVELVACQ